MLSLEVLLSLINDLESDRVERTRASKDMDKFCQTVCAFSNDLPHHNQPGYLIVGVDDKTGKRTGLRVTDELLKDLASIANSGSVQPLPTIHVNSYSFDDNEGDVAVVEVMPSLLPPVRYKGRVWVRIGPTQRSATEQEERILTERRISHELTYDARPCLGSSISELNRELFLVTYLPNAVSSDVIEENNRNLEEQLASLRLYDPRRQCPTHAGILLLGQDPLHWIPGAYIQFVRFDGDDSTNPVLNEKQFSGDLLTLLRNLDDFIELEITRYPVLESALQERMILDYPLVALRELLMNAVLHRNYEGSTSPIRFFWFSGRIEIHSPGGLYGEVTSENFPDQTSYRNPVLAEALKVMGYVNRFGVGVQRAQRALRENGNPPADFGFETNSVLAVIRKRS
ncbi:MAG: ATP-binding protein [bacterium]